MAPSCTQAAGVQAHARHPGAGPHLQRRAGRSSGACLPLCLLQAQRGLLQLVQQAGGVQALGLRRLRLLHLAEQVLQLRLRLPRASLGLQLGRLGRLLALRTVWSSALLCWDGSAVGASSGTASPWVLRMHHLRCSAASICRSSQQHAAQPLVSR